MNALMTAYQGQLKDLGLSGLGIRPLDHPLKPFNGDFVGTDACTNCHEESYRVWKKSPHSRAFATLKNANRRGTTIRSASVATWWAGTRRVLSLSRAATSARRKRPS